MKTIQAGCKSGLRILVAVMTLQWPWHGAAQGVFGLDNFGALTHIGTPDGPLAGTNIYAQALVGLSAQTLVPLGDPVPHHKGRAGEGIYVPFAPAGVDVQVQMAVWDSTLWGPDFLKVPAAQIGYTDVVPVFLETPTAPGDYPQFTRAAVVPVPEPSALALLVCAALAFRTRRRRGLSTAINR